MHKYLVETFHKNTWIVLVSKYDRLLSEQPDGKLSLMAKKHKQHQAANLEVATIYI